MLVHAPPYGGACPRTGEETRLPHPQASPGGWAGNVLGMRAVLKTHPAEDARQSTRSHTFTETRGRLIKSVEDEAAVENIVQYTAV